MRIGIGEDDDFAGFERDRLPKMAAKQRPSVTT
jgi:hypothetical protein